MPLEITDAGVQIQSLEEIIEEMAASLRSKTGDNTDTGTDSVLGHIIKVNAEQVAKNQALLLALSLTWNPNGAKGVLLEAIGAVTNTFKKAPTFSKSISGQANGSPATSIDNGDRVRLVESDEVWEVVEGPFVIPGGGSIAVTIQAVDTGPKTFQITPISGWSIETPKAGWTSFETPTAITATETGTDAEVDGPFRERRKTDTLKTGNDVDAIRAAILEDDGVTVASVTENLTSVVVDGIPPGALEAVVVGGADADIAAAIQAHRPPGAEAFGSSSENIVTSEGQTIAIGLTRPVTDTFDVQVTATATGAERPLPPDHEQLIKDAIILKAKDFEKPGRDVIPRAFIGDVYAALRTNDGVDTLTDLLIEMRTGVASFTDDPTVLDHKRIASFSEDDITVTTVV